MILGRISNRKPAGCQGSQRVFHIRLLAAVAALTVALSSLVPLAQARGVGLSPTTVELPADPGTRHRQSIAVSNYDRQRRVALTVNLADWVLDKEGKLVLSAPGSSAMSASDWVQFSPANLLLEPGDTQMVTVEIQVPVKAGAPGDHRTAILVSEVLPPEDERRQFGSGVWNRWQIASLFYVMLQPIEVSPVIMSAAAGSHASGDTVINYEVENRGNSRARLSGDVVLRTTGGDEALRLPAGQVVMPGQTHVALARIPAQGLPAGRYQVDFDLTFDAGTQHLPVPVAPGANLSMQVD